MGKAKKGEKAAKKEQAKKDKEEKKEQKKLQKEESKQSKQNKKGEEESSEGEEVEQTSRLKIEGKREKNVLLLPNTKLPAMVTDLTPTYVEYLFEESGPPDLLKYPIRLDISDPQLKLTEFDRFEAIPSEAIFELVLSSNNINTLKPEKLEFPKLKVLRIDENKLRSLNLPSEMRKLRYLSVTHNLITSIPNFEAHPFLQYINLAHNKLSEGWENILTLKKPVYLFLESNQFNFTQEQFNESIIKLRKYNKCLREFSLQDNPLQSNVAKYKEWVLSNLKKLKTFDGMEYDAKQRREMLLDEAPSSDDEDLLLESGESDFDSDLRYMGPKVKTKLADMTKSLKKTHDKPQETLLVIRDVQASLLQHVELEDPRGRELFEQDDEAVRLGKVSEADLAKRDLRDPELILEDFFLAIEAIIARQPSVAVRAMGLVATLLLISNRKLYRFGCTKLEEYLRAGEYYSDIVVENLVKIVVRLQDSKTTEEIKHIVMDSLTYLTKQESVVVALRIHAEALATWFLQDHASTALCGVIANVTEDSKISKSFETGNGGKFKAEIHERTVKLLFMNHREFAKRNHLLRVVGNLSRHSEFFAMKFTESNVVESVLDEINPMLQGAVHWTVEQTDRAADCIVALNGVSLNSEKALQTIQTSGFVDRVMKLAKRVDIHPRLFTHVLRAMHGLIDASETIEELIQGMGGVVNLLRYFEGDTYQSMCATVGAIAENGDPTPISHLSNVVILDFFTEIVRILTLFNKRANGPPERADTISAIKLCTRLDRAGREDHLFKLLGIPSAETLRMCVVNCLRTVPLSNFQDNEVEHLVNTIARVENLSIGQTEQIVSGILEILSNIASDTTHVGTSFRKAHTDCIHIVLQILTRNSSRDTRSSVIEGKEKASLSNACTKFLLAASDLSLWPEAMDIMGSRTSILRMGEILRFEELFGQPESPVMIEKTGCGRTVQALLIVLNTLTVGSSIAKRVLIRLAEVLEGRTVSENVTDASIPPPINFEEESAEGMKFRLHQHSIFSQMDGVDQLLRYLRKDEIQTQTSLYQLHGLDTFFQSILDEEQTRMDAQMLGEDKEGVEAMDILRDGFYYLVMTNEDLHSEEHITHVDEGDGVLGKRMAKRRFEEDPRAACLAAALRVFQAVTKYGSAVSRQQALKKGRSVSFLKSLVLMCDNYTFGQWYQEGVGSNLLTIISELISIPRSSNSESASIIPLYDVCGQVFYRIVNVLDKRLDTIISKSHEKHLMESEEEILFQKLASAMLELVVSLQYIRPVDSAESNEAAQDNILMEIIDLKMITAMVHYLFYDRIIASLSWNEPDTTGEVRLVTRELVTQFVCEYLHVNDELRFSILEIFNRMEIKKGIPLRPSFVAYLLASVSHVTYGHNLENHMHESFYFPKDYERILFVEWITVDPFTDPGIDHYLESARDKTKKIVNSIMSWEEDRMIKIRPPDKKLRLIVITNQAQYLFKKPDVEPCGACADSAFCPTGPILLKRVDFKSIEQVTVNRDGQRCSILYTKKDANKGKVLRTCAYLTLKEQMFIRMTNLLIELYPLRPKPPIVYDTYFENGLKSQMKSALRKKELEKELEGKTRIQVENIMKARKANQTKEEEEVMIGFVGCQREVKTEDKKNPYIRVDRWAFISSSHFYLLIEDEGMWLMEQQRMQAVIEEKEAKRKRDEVEEAEIEKLKSAGLYREKVETPDERSERIKQEKALKDVALQKEQDIASRMPQYVSLDISFRLDSLKEVEFSHTVDPAVQIKHDGGKLVLHFVNDPGRERFRLLLKRGLDLTKYKREFLVPFGGGTTETVAQVPSHAVAISTRKR